MAYVKKHKCIKMYRNWIWVFVLHESLKHPIEMVKKRDNVTLTK